MVWVIKLLGKLFKPLQSLTSNISRSLWFHLEFLLFRITRNAIFSENLFMLVSIFSLIFFGGFFVLFLRKHLFLTLEKCYFCFLFFISLCSLEDLMILGVCQVLFSGFLFRQFQLSIHAFTKIWKRILQNTFSESEISVISRMGDFLNLKGRYTFHHIHLGKSTPHPTPQKTIFFKVLQFSLGIMAATRIYVVIERSASRPDG